VVHAAAANLAAGRAPGTGLQPPALAERTFRFVQATPVCSYLIALAIGELEARDIGPRSKVKVRGAARWKMRRSKVPGGARPGSDPGSDPGPKHALTLARSTP
jgi:hypothetical protein